MLYMVINLSQYMIALLREKMLLREKIRSILNGVFHCSVGFFVVLQHIFDFFFPSMDFKCIGPF